MLRWMYRDCIEPRTRLKNVAEEVCSVSLFIIPSGKASCCIARDSFPAVYQGNTNRIEVIRSEGIWNKTNQIWKVHFGGHISLQQLNIYIENFKLFAKLDSARDRQKYSELMPINAKTCAPQERGLKGRKCQHTYRGPSKKWLKVVGIYQTKRYTRWWSRTLNTELPDIVS